MRISITGPESTGKSWLSEHLAKHYQTTWVPEYAREYLEHLNKDYSYQDILIIAKKQFEKEEIAATNHPLIFCDTDILVTYIWCMVKFGKCHKWIEQQLEKNHYDLYLLCDIDLPWVYDKLREHPHKRAELFDLYSNELTKRGFNYSIINGIDDNRLQHAIRIVNPYLKQGSVLKSM